MINLTSLSIPQITPLVLALMILYFLISLLKCKKMSRKDYFKAFALAVILTLLSLLVTTNRYSGDGISYVYGWPHSFYQVWEGLDRTSFHRGFQIGLMGIYLISNIAFYFFLVLSIQQIACYTRSKWHN